MNAALPTIGIFGAGKSGAAIARRALAAGYPVTIAASGPAEDTALLVEFVAPGAAVTTAAELPARADILLIAVPLRRLRQLPLKDLDSRIVIDVMNYWPPVDGRLPEFETPDRPSSLVVADALPPTARLVKTFNHLGYHQMEELPRPAHAPDRTALAVTGDDPTAVATVARLIDALGFDPVHAGTLADSRALEPDSAVFGQRFNQAQMRQVLTTDRAA